MRTSPSTRAYRRAETFEWSIAVVSNEGPGMTEGLAPPDALLRLAQAQKATPAPYAPDLWVSYGGSGAEAILQAAGSGLFAR